MYGSSIHRRLKAIEDKTGGSNFFERMEFIFKTESFEQLTSKDVMALKQYLPDKYEFLVSEIYKLMQANI